MAAKVGPIVLSYAAGLLLGLSGLLPESATAPRTSVTEASLGLALPLLLFAVDIPAWGRVAGRAMLSMFCAVVAVVTISTLLYFLFTAQGVAQVEQLSGMAVGMYTGGVANLAAIQHALDISSERFLLFATVDTVIGALYLLFVLTLAPRLFDRFLPADRPVPDARESKEFNAALPPFGVASLPSVLIAVLAAGLCVGLALALTPYVGFLEPPIAVIVLLTTFGLIASFIRPLRQITYSTHLGMYLIYVFSFCIAASMDLGSLAGMDLSILLFVALATVGGLLLHAILCRLVNIDRDTFLITSVAALMSPAFVPMVARSLGNPAILLSGITTGILGFAIGNYLGITVALLLAP